MNIVMHGRPTRSINLSCQIVWLLPIRLFAYVECVQICCTSKYHWRGLICILYAIQNCNADTSDHHVVFAGIPQATSEW